MDHGAPEVTVVVATRNRAGRLRALLGTLAAQEGPAVEAVVIDDGSDDSTPRVLDTTPDGLDLHVIRHERSLGPAASRNEGWRAAHAPLVVFADDDVVVDRTFAAEFLQAHRQWPDAVLQGLTEANPEELEHSTVFWRSMRVLGVDPFFPTCNIAYPFELLERLGGFDEHYRRPAGEDTDLGWRARELGVEPRFVESARARHAVHQMGVIPMLKDARRLADNVRVAKRHPGIRRAYTHGLFWNEAHERLLLLAAGACAARRSRGVSLLLGLPYVLWYAQHHRGPLRAAVALPAYAAIDMVQMASLVAGSIRYRTLVL
ncbi:MAG: glycosyltransferase family 2 protein [Solirubrobacteraceae bacterium]